MPRRKAQTSLQDSLRGWTMESRREASRREGLSGEPRLRSGIAEHACSLSLVCAADPANLYGSGAPLDIELLEGGVARLPRGSGNFLVMSDGRPVLVMESDGKRLTGLSWADRSRARSRSGSASRP